DELGRLFHLEPGPTLLIYDNPKQALIGFDLNPLLRGDFTASLIPTQLYFKSEFGSISYGALDGSDTLGLSRPKGDALVPEREFDAGYEWLAERIGFEGSPSVHVSLYRGGGLLQ